MSTTAPVGPLPSIDEIPFTLSGIVSIISDTGGALDSVLSEFWVHYNRADSLSASNEKTALIWKTRIELIRAIMDANGTPLPITREFQRGRVKFVVNPAKNFVSRGKPRAAGVRQAPRIAFELDDNTGDNTVFLAGDSPLPPRKSILLVCFWPVEFTVFTVENCSFMIELEEHELPEKFDVAGVTDTLGAQIQGPHIARARWYVHEAGKIVWEGAWGPFTQVEL